MKELLRTMFDTAAASPFFGITLSVFTYQIGIVVHRKWKSALTSPLIVSSILCCLFLWITGIPFGDYNRGGYFISLFLGPATAVLAVAMYNQLDTLKKNLIPILVGTVVGTAVSTGSILFMCRLFRLDRVITASLLPKSVTTPIALSLSEATGGIAGVTSAAVIFTGILGTIIAEPLLKLLRVKNPVAAGLAIGVSSHAMGTTKAIEIGETEGSISALAIGCAGIATVVISAIISI
ncbi:LrgB family protein [Treponema brennaborense]|uniref:LrgB family protein n=1 Tax=Treponema brennaborense (strain DSM 12168 / CIP 105900 / DD5/3) TaxID=906968 RepID=F4LPE3_TREBD|nr:LrgB family protein [Treponema brennaborense]AEE15954.1 LrgB family protein [Treponema brennaborense DSM 12168]